MSQFKPYVSRRGDDVLLKYNLGSRIHDIVDYPVQAPNGSSILLCGHASGITILWKGGRRRRRKQPQSNAVANTKVSRTRGSGDADTIMIIDSDEEGHDHRRKSDVSQQDSSYESDDENEDVSDSGEPIIASLNLELEQRVIHIAAPCAPVDSVTVQRDSVAPILAHKAVFAVACDDHSVRLIAVDLEPPSGHKHVKLQLYGKLETVEQLIFSNDLTPPRGLPTGVSLAFSSSDLDSGNNFKAASATWEFIIFAHYPEPLPSILLYTARLAPSEGHSCLTEAATLNLPIQHAQDILMTSSFCSSRFPSTKHRQLLVVDVTGRVRTCQVAESLDAGQHTPVEWLNTFTPPFQTHQLRHPGRSYRRILDAKWALEGKCIVVLLNDGRWGVWDLEGVGPALQYHRKGIDDSPTVTEGGVTPFSLEGRVGQSSKASAESPAAPEEGSDSLRSRGSLAPMTPNTRKGKQGKLFEDNTSKAPVSARSMYGGLSVSPLPASSKRQSADNSIVFWFNDEVFVVPSLMNYWRSAKQRDEHSFPTLQGSPARFLSDFNARGERIVSMVQVYRNEDSPDIVLSGEHRLMMLCPPRHQERRPEPKQLQRLFQPPQASSIDGRADQSRLRRGELDLGGMDRILNNMNQNAGASRFGNIDLDSARPKKVGFARDF